MLLCRKWAKHPILTATLIFNYFDQSTHPALKAVVCFLSTLLVVYRFTATCMAMLIAIIGAIMRERVCRFIGLVVVTFN